MATITVPGIVDNVTHIVSANMAHITTHPTTDRPSITLTLTENLDNPPTFAKDDEVNVTIASA